MAGFCVFAAFLIFTGIKLMFVSVHNHSLEDNRLLKLLRRRMNVTEGLRGNAVFVRKPDPAIGKLTRFAAPLFLPLILIELADLVFTVDSGLWCSPSPPILSWSIPRTSEPFWAFARFFALAAILHRFAYLKHAMSLLLAFITDLLSWARFPPSTSHSPLPPRLRLR